MRLLALCIAIIAGTFAQTARAAEPMPLTYEQFEAAVSHLDLAKCPAGLPQQSAFCRATINHHEVHVFTFSENADQPLIAFATYDVDAVKSLLE